MKCSDTRKSKREGRKRESKRQGRGREEASMRTSMHPFAVGRVNIDRVCIESGLQIVDCERRRVAREVARAGGLRVRSREKEGCERGRERRRVAREVARAAERSGKLDAHIVSAPRISLVPCEKDEMRV